MVIKKNAIATGFIFSSILLLGACGNEEQVTEPVTEEAADYDGVEDGNPEGGLAAENVGGEVFGFVDFNLDVDYPEQDDALKVSYEEDKDKVESEYVNAAANEELAGNDAFDVIEPLLAQLELTADTSDEDVINKVIEVFSIEENYESIELEVTYPDGTDKDYEASGN